MSERTIYRNISFLLSFFVAFFVTFVFRPFLFSSSHTHISLPSLHLSHGASLPLPFIIPFPTRANRDPISRNRRVYYGGDHFCNLKTRLISFPRLPPLLFFSSNNSLSFGGHNSVPIFPLAIPFSRRADAFLFLKKDK